MISLFNYNTLEAHLNLEGHSLTIRLNRPAREHALNCEMLLELEDLFTWAANHMEVKSILLSSTFSGKNLFCSGWDQEELKTLNKDKLAEQFEKLQKLIYSFFFLPQTLIVDLKHGSRGVGSELCLGADMRVMHEKGDLHFDHLNRGLVPSCGGIGFLSEIVGQTNARNWVLSGEPVDSDQLQKTGLLYKTYDAKTPVFALLKTLSKQSPTARIQAKRSFLETIMSKFEKAIEAEKLCSLPGLQITDWKEALHALEENRLPKFLKARDVFKMVTESV